MSDENLAGLIIVDEDWYLDSKNSNTLACGVTIRLVDDAGNVLFSGEHGLATDGEAKLSSLGQDFLRNLTFSLAGRA